jgi:class 3 adenylate cyclase
MFYGDEIPARTVLGMLLTLQDRIAAECEIGIGICAHVGEFYRLGRAIYGPDADLVESVAEDHTAAGELVLTEALRGRLGEDPALQLTLREELRAQFGPIWRLVDGPRFTDLTPTDFRYPLPFTDEFYTGLGQYQRSRRTSIVPRPAYQDCTVVVIDREREDGDEPAVAALNNLALAAAVRRLGGELVDTLDGQEIKTTGQVSIYLFHAATHALAFARKLRSELAAQRVELRIGMDCGRVLLFELAPGSFDLAGSPVNVASKLAQDAGRFGAIHLTRETARQAGMPDNVSGSTVRVSGVEIEMIVV